MTREVAIKAIQDFIGWFKEDSLIRKALEMAMQALSQEPICDRDCEHCTWTECPIEPCDDVVSREKVLEMITDFATLELYIDKHNHVTFEPLEKLIKSLPSVTQKSALEQIRAEIDGLYEGMTNYYDNRPWMLKDKVLEIIDKYKGDKE